MRGDGDEEICEAIYETRAMYLVFAEFKCAYFHSCANHTFSKYLEFVSGNRSYGAMFFEWPP